MRNDIVAKLWFNGKNASALNFSCRDGNLYSYNLRIGYHENGKAYVMNYRSGGRFVSQTTSKHVGLALRAGAILVDAS